MRYCYVDRTRGRTDEIIPAAREEVIEVPWASGMGTERRIPTPPPVPREQRPTVPPPSGAGVRS